MSTVTRSSNVFNSNTLLNDDEYYVFEIKPLATVSAKDVVAENIVATDFSGLDFSLDKIVYSPDTNMIQAITTQNITFSENFGCNFAFGEQNYEVFPAISKVMPAEGVGLVNYGFYDRDGNPIYDISERIDLIFKATLINSSDEDITDRTFRFSKNATSEIVDEQTLSIPKGTGIEVEIVCDFELAYGDRITLY